MFIIYYVNPYERIRSSDDEDEERILRILNAENTQLIL